MFLIFIYAIDFKRLSIVNFGRVKSFLFFLSFFKTKMPLVLTFMLEIKWPLYVDFELK